MGSKRALALTFALGLALAAGAAAAEPAAGEPGKDAVLATLPFQPAPSNRQIVIDLAPKGNARRMPFQLDTGATVSWVTPVLARSMGVKVSRTRTDPYRRRTVLGRDVLFYVDTRRSDTGSTSGVEFGLLGADFLVDYVLELDFAKQQVRFLDPKRFQVPAGAAAEGEAVLPLKLVSNRIGLGVVLDGHPVDVLLDTGAETGLLLSGEVARAAGIEFAPLEGARGIGVVGSVELHGAEVGRLEIGPFAFDGFPARVSPSGFYNVGLPGDALLGFDLLRHFLVRIDYPRQRLWLRRRYVETPPQAARARGDAPAVSAELAPLMPAAIPPQPDDAHAALPPRDTSGRQVWLEWKLPAVGTRIAGPVGFVPVEGWAGVGDPIRHDVVLAIDVSGSTAIASGADVDSDGELGRQRRRVDDWRTFNPRHLSSDAGDTVLAAELTAARRLVELLDPDRTRIGLVAFSDAARILAPLGSPRERIEQVLDDLDQAWGAGATNLADAIARGAEVLLIDADPEKRRKTLIVLSDGFPSTPGTGDTPANEAYEEAVLAARDGVRIDAFGLGLAQHGRDEKDVYVEIAKVSGGHYRALPKPGSVVQELPRIELADVAAVEIENATSGARGRALRVLPDGSFDGVVELEDGENRIRVTARDASGARFSDERLVHFEKRRPRDAAEEAAFERQLAELRRKLEQRRVESELIAEIQATRAQQRRLEVRAEEPAAQP